MRLTRRRQLLPATLALAAMAGLAGCATLPSSGPTGVEVRAAQKDSPLAFRIVDIDIAVARELGRPPAVEQPLGRLPAAGRVDTVGAGDVLDINIYEVGVTIFSGSATGSGAGSAGFDPAARATRLGDVVVDAAGTITLPFVGRLSVAGATPAEIQRMIERGLRGKSQSPQVLVSVKNNASNVFYVSGDVRTPGRYALGLPRERLLDAIARAGGTVNAPNDMIVRLTRGTVAVETRLSEVNAGGVQDTPLLPGDRVEMINRPRTFLMFGATNKVAQVPFGASTVTLAEALARSGGPNDNLADPSAIYLFRYGAVPAGIPADTPIIYRLDMSRPDAFFLSQDFALQDKDVIYIANARANAPAKMATILGQLFSPFLAFRAVAGY